MRMIKRGDANPEGRCLYCNRPVRYRYKYCAYCGKPNDSWVEPTQSQCGNCHNHLQEGDKYCRLCGTKVGEGAYEPYQDVIQFIYGPMPFERKHACKICGHSWITCLMVDKEKYCPECGGSASEVSISEEEIRKYRAGIMENLID